MENSVKYPKVYTVEECARIFRLSAEAVRNLIRKGEISAIRIGKQYRIPQHVIDRFFAQTASPEELGFGAWKSKSINSLKYVNMLRARDRSTPETFIKDLLSRDK